MRTFPGSEYGPVGAAADGDPHRADQPGAVRVGGAPLSGSQVRPQQQVRHQHVVVGRQGMAAVRRATDAVRPAAAGARATSRSPSRARSPTSTSPRSGRTGPAWASTRPPTSRPTSRSTASRRTRWRSPGRSTCSRRFPEGLPPEPEQDGFIKDSCTKLTDAYLAPVQLRSTTLTLIYSTLSLPSWSAGSREVACSIGATLGNGGWATLLNSAKGAAEDQRPAAGSAARHPAGAAQPAARFRPACRTPGGGASATGSNGRRARPARRVRAARPERPGDRPASDRATSTCRANAGARPAGTRARPRSPATGPEGRPPPRDGPEPPPPTLRRRLPRPPPGQ